MVGSNFNEKEKPTCYSGGFNTEGTDSEETLGKHYSEKPSCVQTFLDRRERGFTMFNNESNGPEWGTCLQLRKEDVAALAWAGRSRKMSLDVLFALNTTLSYSTGPGSSVLWSVVK